MDWKWAIPSRLLWSKIFHIRQRPLMVWAFPATMLGINREDCFSRTRSFSFPKLTIPANKLVPIRLGLFDALFGSYRRIWQHWFCWLFVWDMNKLLTFWHDWHVSYQHFPQGWKGCIFSGLIILSTMQHHRIKASKNQYFPVLRYSISKYIFFSWKAAHLCVSRQIKRKITSSQSS